MPLLEKNQLRLFRGQMASPIAQAAYDRLLRDVLAIEIETDTVRSNSWNSFSYFAPDDRCVANVDAAILPLVLDGVEAAAAGIRSVAVDPGWRGHGLFRDLMEEALVWSEARGATLALLYTEDPALYGRFGFRLIPQHAVVGPAPVPSPGPPARRLDLGLADDRQIIAALVGRRVPLSAHFALGVDATLFMANIGQDEALEIAHSVAHDALFVYEADADELIIADVVARVVPDMATVLGALGVTPVRVKTLFPPDRLSWHGKSVREDTGLMIRGLPLGPIPRPFMFPPTVEF